MQAEALQPSPPDASGTHSLPSIPTLPPIEIPHSDLSPALTSSGSSSKACRRESEDNQPSSAALSEESYATACSSPLATPAEYFGDDALTDSRPQQSPSSRVLSKSFSVDSFARDQQLRGSGSTSPTDSMRTAGPSSIKKRLSIIEPEVVERWRVMEAEQRPTITAPQPRPSTSSGSGIRGFASRVRRQSRLHRPFAGNRTTEDEIDSSTYEDSEHEHGSQENRAAAKTKELRRRLLTPKRSGSTPTPTMNERVQLPAPSRSRRLSSMVLNAKQLPPDTIKATATQVANGPLRSPILRNQASAPTSLNSPRIRAQTLNHKSDDYTKRPARPPVTLHIDTENLSKPDIIPLTVAVLGARRCGKSSFIRRAWRISRTDTATEHMQANTQDGSGRIIRYTCRKAYMNDFQGKDYILKLIEVRVEDLLYQDGKMHGSFWPSILPKIDAVFILYNASERPSFDHVEDLIRGCRDHGLPFIVLACKSDLQHAIPPAEASEVASRYDGGIIEISSNDVGREKAQRSVHVILRGILRRRNGDIDPNMNPCSPNLHGAPIPMPWDKRVTSRSPPPNSTTSLSAASKTKSKHTSSHYSSNELPIQHPPPQGPLPLPPQLPAPQSPLPALPVTPINSLTFVRDGPVDLPAPLPQHPQDQITSTSTTEPQSPAKPLQTINSPSTSPSRPRSMSDINQQHTAQHLGINDKTNIDHGLRSSKSIMDLAKSVHESTENLTKLDPVADSSAQMETNEPQQANSCESPISLPKKELKQQQSIPWASLDELFDKLFFLAVSGDDPSFIQHFFLTYRRFATPRRVLLAMQKRMLDLNQTVTDYSLSSYAQMRICNLLEQWTQEYPNDFAVPGAAGALNALIKQILRQTHTLYYGSDLLPFIEMLHSIQDLDSAWAMPELSVAEDDSDSNYDADGHSEGDTQPSSLKNESILSANSSQPSGRDRKASLSFSAKAIMQTPIASVPSPTRDMIARLAKTSNALLHFDSDDVAKEITRCELELYMAIEPRDWLRHTLVSGKKDPNHDRIARFNSAFNDLHDWATSMVLCHDKPKLRARVIEKLADIAVKLRNMNNYSGLRAIITAITQATYPNDEVMEIFSKCDLYKKYLSSDILMRTAGAHQSYRLALRNTKGPCIPCLEVHTSDLRRAHEGNPDYKPDDPEKVHWAKFSMIGKFVGITTQLQAQCRSQPGYNIPENPAVAQLFDVPIMDYDMQQERLGLPPADDAEPYSAYSPPAFGMEHSGNSKESGGLVKRLLFWST